MPDYLLESWECCCAEELEKACEQWWAMYQRYTEALKYSNSCISDSEHQEEALRQWQACSERLSRIRAEKDFL